MPRTTISHGLFCRVLAAAALAVLAAGLFSCGKKGDPLPPLRPVPGAAEELTLRQIGDQLRLQWKAPARNEDGTTEGVALREAQVLRRVLDRSTPAEEEVSEPPAPAEAASEVPAKPSVSIPPFPTEAVVVAGVESTILGEVREHEEAVDPSWIGKRVEYAVRYVNRKGRESALSEVVAVEPSARIEPPRELRAEAGDGFVALSWSPPPPSDEGAGISFFVFRRLEGAEGYSRSPLNSEPLSVASFEDESVAFGAPACYVVIAARAPAAAAAVESVPADEVCITPMDRFPPPVPAGLVAVASTEGILLSWNEVEAPDLRAYRIYRAESASGPFTLLSEVPTSSYTDRSVSSGAAFFYAVTAIDDSPGINESERSEVVEARRGPP